MIGDLLREACYVENRSRDVCKGQAVVTEATSATLERTPADQEVFVRSDEYQPTFTTMIKHRSTVVNCHSRSLTAPRPIREASSCSPR